MAQHPLKDGMANHPHSMLPGTQSPDSLPDFATKVGVTMANGNLRPFHPGANRGDMGVSIFSIAMSLIIISVTAWLLAGFIHGFCVLRMWKLI